MQNSIAAFLFYPHCIDIANFVKGLMAKSTPRWPDGAPNDLAAIDVRVRVIVPRDLR